MNTLNKTKNIGINISKIRELRGMKQDALAESLGITQQAVSYLENCQTVDEDKIIEVAKILSVTPEIIRNFDEEYVFNLISNSICAKDNSNYQPSFNPIDKLITLYEEKDKQREEKEKLYEQLLAAEREKLELIREMIGRK